ncbi:MAG: hypothetical protein GW809_09055 [Bacteroidetes bacterium]|nr:hypothetical protein [Bacteroidota bacterium]NCQ12268.1 hypothetical protein [Bacteroidota bacterium]
MDVSTIAVGISFGMSLLSVLGMALFGAKNLISGKHEMQKILVLVIPFLVFGGVYFATGSADEAAMLTMLIMLGFMAILIAFSAIKSVFNF